MGIFQKSKKENINKANVEEAVNASVVPARIIDSKIVIKSPWITEKTLGLAKSEKYVFVVEKNVSQNEIKRNIESRYKVKVRNINIINTKPKERRLGRSMGKISGIRKAIVTIEKGQTIDIMPH